MNKEWAELNRIMQLKLKKESTFDEGRIRYLLRILWHHNRNKFE